MDTAASERRAALVKLMEHTVAARRDPAYSMPILQAAATQAVALESVRPEADVVVRSVMSMPPEFGSNFYSHFRR